MNKIGSVNILGVRIDVITKKKLNDLIIDRAKASYSRPLVVFKPYVEFLSLADRNDSIRKLLNRSDINAPDSVSLQWAASYLYGKPSIHPGSFHAYYSVLVRARKRQWLTQILPDRMAGLDQTIPLLKTADKLGLRVGILGGPKDIDSTKNELKKRFKNIDFHVWSGYFDSKDEAVLVRQIAASRVDILFCALGFPKQEKFIIEYKNRLNAKIIIGEGGSFDYDQLGGRVKRAPKWVRNIGFEWLWRLLGQPSRIKRQMAIPSFINRIKKQKSHSK